MFVVDNVVKGELGSTVEVSSPADGATCGFELERDVATGILLSADPDGEGWTSGLCGQIAVGELVAAVGATDEPLVNWGGIVVGVTVLALGALLLARRLRQRRGSLDAWTRR